MKYTDANTKSILQREKSALTHTYSLKHTNSHTLNLKFLPDRELIHNPPGILIKSVRQWASLKQEFPKVLQED